MPTDPSEVAVTLICASADEPMLGALVERLRAAGTRARVVSGAERDVRSIGNAIDEVRGRGLFIVCLAKHLDEPATRRVEGMYAARRGPLHRLIRIEVLGRSPVVLVTRIRRECEDIARMDERAVPIETDEPALHLREVVQVGERVAISLPAVRLSPGEELDGDTMRIDLPDTAKSAELMRRRKALRERERERARGRGGQIADEGEPGSTASGRVPTMTGTGLHEPVGFVWDRNTISLVVGVAVLAVLAALSLGGVFS